MKIQYIGHSGFLVELSELVLIFDYYEGEVPEFNPSKEVYYFVSHKHYDHFNPEIFEAVKKYSKITFVLSEHTRMKDSYMDQIGVPEKARDRIRYVSENESVRIDQNLLVETLTSTDEGVAFLITVTQSDSKEVSIYHAGDLNWWSWPGESEEYNEDMKDRYFTEMKKLEGRSFDCAFVPLDPRQEERFYWGLDAFMKVTNTSHVYPMHCWEDYSVIDRLISMKESEDYRSRIARITRRGQQFEQ